jgi:hypothetical protein
LKLAAGCTIAFTLWLVSTHPNTVQRQGAVHIAGMQEMGPEDLARFAALAERLAVASHTDPQVKPMLERTLAQSDRGIVKRAIAYMALHRMGKDNALSGSFNDRAVLQIAAGCDSHLTLADSHPTGL